MLCGGIYTTNIMQNDEIYTHTQCNSFIYNCNKFSTAYQYVAYKIYILTTHNMQDMQQMNI